MRILALAFLVLGLAAGGPTLAQQPSRELGAEAVQKAEAARKSEPQISVAGAKNEEQAKARLRADAKLRECVIKPVMTDEEIGACKDAYRASREAQASTGK